MALDGELPSIYDQLGPLQAPPVDLHASTRSATDRRHVHQLVQTCEQGTAGTFLHSVLEQSHRDAIRNWRKRSSRTRRGGPAAANDTRAGGTEEGLDHDDDVDDDEELELRERGYVHKRRSTTRTRSASVASIVSAEGDDELGSETEVAHNLTTTDRGGRSHKDKVQTSRRRLRRLRDNLRIPDVPLDDPDLPPGELRHALPVRSPSSSLC